MVRAAHLVIAVIPWLIVLTASAQTDADKTTARELFHRASVAMDANRYSEAEELFRLSNELFPAPTARLGRAEALRELGRWVEAHELFLAVARLVPAPDASAAFLEAISDAKRASDDLRPRLPSVIISIEGPVGATARLDGVELPAAAIGIPRFLDPGPHLFEASAPGHRASIERATAVEAKTIDVRLRLVTAEPQPKEVAKSGIAPTPRGTSVTPQRPAGPSESRAGRGQRTAGFVALGVGGALLATAAITGGLYLRDARIVDAGCQQLGENRSLCQTEEALDAARRGKALGIANTVAWFASAAAVGVGLGLVIAAPRERSHTATLRLGPWIGRAMGGVLVTVTDTGR
jgi:tetratricopeptide (TPR) repeat protein